MHVDEYRKRIKRMRNIIIRKDGDRREIYKNDIVLQSDLGIGPYRVNANWSMSAVDCLGLGIPVVCPNIATFPEFVPKKLLYNKRNEAIMLINKLLSNRKFWEKCSEESRQKVLEFLPKVMVKKFIAYLHEN